MTLNRKTLKHIRALIEQAAKSLSDEDALTGIELFPAWQVDTLYEVNDRIRYNGKLYRVVQTHTSQEQWPPDLTPALWTEVAEPGTIPVWRQPAGAQDAYMQGDKVHYPDENGPVYISIIDYNTWAPDVYGWDLVN